MDLLFIAVEYIILYVWCSIICVGGEREREWRRKGKKRWHCKVRWLLTRTHLGLKEEGIEDYCLFSATTTTTVQQIPSKTRQETLTFPCLLTSFLPTSKPNASSFIPNPSPDRQSAVEDDRLVGALSISLSVGLIPAFPLVCGASKRLWAELPWWHWMPQRHGQKKSWSLPQRDPSSSV